MDHKAQAALLKVFPWYPKTLLQCNMHRICHDVQMLSLVFPLFAESNPRILLVSTVYHLVVTN